MDQLKRKVGVRGMVIHSQSQAIIANVLEFMKEEARNSVPTIPLQNFKERLILATKISANTYVRISNQLKEINAGTRASFSTPHKDRPRKSRTTSLLTGEIGTIRLIIHDFYIIEKRRPTLKVILNKIRNSGLFRLSSLSTVIKKMGFKWKLTSDKRKILMESHDIRLKRIQYLKSFVEYRKEGRPFIYLDETYLHSSHTQPREWANNTVLGLKKPVSKGKRLVILHAGGFIPGALLMFRSGTKSGDFHDEMNFENFSTWLITRLIPNLPPKSLIIVDNASYHNVKVNKDPTSNTLKKDMVTWLTERNISHSNTDTKTILYDIIKLHKTKHHQYKLDTILNEYGHNVFKLPPYHPEFNPIEMIWATMNNWVAAKNITFKIADVEALAREKFNSITSEEWSSVCSHSDKIVDQYLEKEHLLDNGIELSFVVNTGNSDDSVEEQDELSGIELLSG